MPARAFGEIKKFNPYHGSDGRFTTGSGATSFTIRTKNPHKQHLVGDAVVKEAANKIRNLDHEEMFIISPEGRRRYSKVGESGQVTNKIGDMRENAPGAVLMHNHPSGGTFSSSDLHELGYMPKEIRAITPEGDYVMRSASDGEMPNWVGLKDSLESVQDGFKSEIQLRKEIYKQKYEDSYNREVGSFAQKWVDAKDSGAPKETLDELYGEWSKANDKWNEEHPKEERNAEATKAYLDQWHQYYQEHAEEYGIDYKFEPVTDIKKFNPYHGKDGRFSTSSGAASFTYKPGKSTAHDNAIAREKERNKTDYTSFSDTRDPDNYSAYAGDGKSQTEFFTKNSNYNELIENMTWQQNAAFADWSNGVWTEGQQYKGWDNMEPEEKYTTQIFDDVLDKSTLSKGVEIIRRADAQLVLGKGKRAASLEELQKMKGTIITAKGNMSFSAASEGLPMTSSGSVEYRLKIPGDTKGSGMYIADERINDWGPQQREYMTNRDISMRVGETTYDKARDVHIVELQYVGRQPHDYGTSGRVEMDF